MARTALALLLLAGILATLHATKVNKCKGAKIPPPSNGDIEISDCAEPPCRLRKRTSPTVLIKFKPEKDLEGLTTRVSAEIASIPFPFIGVDGTSACGNVYLKDGKTKVSCPLKAGNEYVYKNSFKVLDLYPNVKVNINWALVNNKTREHVSCFEVQARIG